MPARHRHPCAFCIPGASSDRTANYHVFFSLQPCVQKSLPLFSGGALHGHDVGAACPLRRHAHHLRLTTVMRGIDPRRELHPFILSSASPNKMVASPPAPLPILHPSHSGPWHGPASRASKPFRILHPTRSIGPWYCRAPYMLTAEALLPPPLPTLQGLHSIALSFLLLSCTQAFCLTAIQPKKLSHRANCRTPGRDAPSNLWAAGWAVA